MKNHHPRRDTARRVRPINTTDQTFRNCLQNQLCNLNRVATILAMCMMVGMGTTVFAEDGENKQTDTVSVSSEEGQKISVKRSDLTPEQQRTFDEHMKKVQSRFSEMTIGEKVEIGELGGDKMYAVLESIEEGTLTKRGFMTTYGTVVVQFENFFGQIKDAFKVQLSCRWYKDTVDGTKSYITDLSGTYVILDNSFRCEWDTSYGSTTAPAYFALYLYAYHNGDTAWYACSATGVFANNSPYIRFDI